MECSYIGGRYFVYLGNGVSETSLWRSFSTGIVSSISHKHFYRCYSQNGQLARSKDMGAKLTTNKDDDNVYDLGKMWIGEVYETGAVQKDKNGNAVLDDSGNPIMIQDYRYFPDLIKEKFLKPAPVCWADASPKRSVISVACGELFLLVVARDEGFESKVYSSGNNGYGQLGHGDTRERHELTSVSHTAFLLQIQIWSWLTLTLFLFPVDQIARGKAYFQSCCRVNPFFSSRHSGH